MLLGIILGNTVSSFETGSLIGPKLTNYAKLAGQQALGIHPPAPISRVRNINAHHHAWRFTHAHRQCQRLNSCPQVCKASTLPTESSLQPRNQVLRALSEFLSS